VLNWLANAVHCDHSDRTRYGQGQFPWELRAAQVLTNLTDFTPELDWETLRGQMKDHGVRNATQMAIAPVESSSVVINSQPTVLSYP
jgi:ribonucleoside-diphosphate reductase alpha chain